jgi:hypothetical protein
LMFVERRFWTLVPGKRAEFNKETGILRPVRLSSVGRRSLFNEEAHS